MKSTKKGAMGMMPKAGGKMPKGAGKKMEAQAMHGKGGMPMKPGKRK